MISKLPELPTELPTLGRSEFNVPSQCDRSYGETLETEATSCMYVLLSSLWASFGDVLGCVMLKAKNHPIIESDNDDSDAGDLDQVACNVKLLQ